MLVTSEFRYAYNPESAEEVIDSIAGAPRLAVDIETFCKPEYRAIMPPGMQALDPHSGGISILSVTREGEIPGVLDIKLLDLQQYNYSRLIEVLRGCPILLAHNANFEIMWLRHKFGLWFTNFMCTLWLGRLHANATGSKFARLRGLRLVDLLRDILDVNLTGKGEEQITDWNARPPLEKLLSDRPEDRNDFAVGEWLSKLKYGATDTVHLFALYDFFREVLDGPLPQSPLIPQGSRERPYGLMQTTVIERGQRALAAYASIEYNGLPCSKEILSSIYNNILDKEGLDGELLRIAGQLCQWFGLETEESWMDDYPKPTTKSLKALNSPAQLKELLKKGLKLGVLDTVDAKVVQRLLDLYSGEDFYSVEEEERYSEIRSLENSITVKYSEVLKLLVRYKQLSKMHQMDLRAYVNPLTGCIHGKVKQAAAATGRCIAAGSRVRVAGKEPTPIEDVEVGDLVFCYSPERKLCLRRVLAVNYQGIAKTVLLKWRSKQPRKAEGQLLCTPEHRILALKRGWVEAQKLRPFDVLMNLPAQVMAGKTRDSLVELFTNPDFHGETLQGNHTFIELEPAQSLPVYDLEVEEHGNFICEEVCVHNSASTSPNTQNISGRTKVSIERPLSNLFVGEARF